jgi:hypothetical protein
MDKITFEAYKLLTQMYVMKKATGSGVYQLNFDTPSVLASYWEELPYLESHGYIQKGKPITREELENINNEKMDESNYLVMMLVLRSFEEIVQRGHSIPDVFQLWIITEEGEKYLESIFTEGDREYIYMILERHLLFNSFMMDDAFRERYEKLYRDSLKEQLGSTDEFLADRVELDDMWHIFDDDE